MPDSRDPLPESKELLQLHQRLIDSDPTAPADLAVTALPPLVLWLRDHNRDIDPDLSNEAAEEAVLSLIRNPGSYRPEVLDLLAYLRMAAQRDLQNLLHRERKHHEQRCSWDCVELTSDAGKYLGRDDDPSLPLQIAEQLQATLD